MVSIIIPTLNEATEIALCLQSVLQLQGSFEVIVVDGGSSDQTRSIIQSFPEVQLIESPAGRGLQQNRGARVAKGDILWFLHADSRVDPKSLGAIKQALESKGNTLGAFTLDVRDSSFKFRLLEGLVSLRSRYLKRPYGDQGLFLERSFFEQLGGFPEVPILEDLTLVRRALQSGRVRTLPLCVSTSSRRWQTHGFLRLTLLHWRIILLSWLGQTPEAIAKKVKNRERSSETTVLVFLKYPEPGNVKTRLGPELGVVGAAAFYWSLTETVLKELEQLSERKFKIILCFSPAEKRAALQSLVGEQYELLPQAEGDLGARMSQAVKESFGRGAKNVIVIGTDCISLKAQHIQTTLALLERNDIVFGPSEDGGYYLLGLRSHEEALFREIPWSSSDTLQQSLKRAHDVGLKVGWLEELRDVDTWQDVLQLPEEWRRLGFHLAQQNAPKILDA